MTDYRDQIWEDRADRAYSQVTHHPYRVAFIVLAVILGLTFVGGIIRFVGGYGHEASRVVGVQNVKDQNTQIISDWQAMKSVATISCEVKASKHQDGDPTLIEDPSVAYAARYETPRQDYDRRMSNLYEAQAVRNLPLPSNLASYPQTAPTLKEMQAQVC